MNAKIDFNDWPGSFKRFLDERHISMTAISEVLGISCSTVWHWIKNGRIPRSDVRRKLL